MENFSHEQPQSTPEQKRQEAMVLFKNRAVENAPEPTYPDIVNTMYEDFQRNMMTIVEDDEQAKIAAAVRDTVTMVKEQYQDVYPEVDINEPTVRDALIKYFGIEL